MRYAALTILHARKAPVIFKSFCFKPHRRKSVNFLQLKSQAFMKNIFQVMPFDLLLRVSKILKTKTKQKKNIDVTQEGLGDTTSSFVQTYSV